MFLHVLASKRATMAQRATSKAANDTAKPADYFGTKTTDSSRRSVRSSVDADLVDLTSHGAGVFVYCISI